MPTGVSSRQVPLLDLVAQHATLREEMLAELIPLIDSQRFIMGPAVGELETALAQYCQVPHAIGCANGSDALLLAWMALDIQPGDEIITTPFSFFATAGSISRLGAVPVFVDIEDKAFNLDANQLEDALKKHERVKSIQPVHLYGGSADMAPILSLAEKHGVTVVEDAAQAIGAEYNGQRCGGIGTIGCFSFYPGKNLGAYGEAGLVTTHDDKLADKIRILRTHGGRNKYFHEYVGMNSRIDTLQAAVLKVKLKYLDAWTEARQRNAQLYSNLIQAPVLVPRVQPYQTRHVFNQFTIQADRRDELKAFLAANGIGSEIYYPLPLHLQECYEYLGYKAGAFPVSERCAQRVLSLPVYPELAEDDIRYVADRINCFCK
jgi:dTDP-4-amino-4,6-dideoxygalactose transaminase